MNFLRKIDIENRRYTWAHLLKYTFYISILSVILLLLYGICFAFIKNGNISLNDSIVLLKENFDYKHFNNQLFPSIVFYIFFEEFIFRKSLIITIKNIAITLSLLLFLGGKSFLDQSVHLYTYIIYSLFIIIIYKRRVNSVWAQKINIAISLITLSAFHVSKFELEYTSEYEILFYHIIPAIIIGIILAHLRLKFNSFASIIAYFLVLSFIHFIHH